MILKCCLRTLFANEWFYCWGLGVVKRVREQTLLARKLSFYCSNICARYTQDAWDGISKAKALIASKTSKEK